MAECSTSCNCKDEIVTFLSPCEHISYINQANQGQKERMKRFLINVDKSNRVNPDSERRNNVLQGVTKIVNDISKEVAEMNPLFTGKILPMGSAHNNTKIGDSNEFDFVFELEVDTLLDGKATFEVTSDYGIVVKFDGKPDSVFCKPLHSSGSDEEGSSEADQDKVEYPEGCMLVDMDALKSKLSDILKSVLSNLKLPDGWQHGGFNRPNFSGLREQGPSLLLQFDYLQTHDHIPLYISVDFVPMIKMSLDTNKEFDQFLDFFSTRTAGSQHCWISPHDGCEHYGTAEETMLSQYSANSTCKVLLRICKALHSLVGMYSPKYPYLDDVEKIADFIKNKTHMQGNTKQVDAPYLDLTATARFLSVLDTGEYLSYSDLGETVGDECMVKSYDIKRLVMGMLAADESQGESWTEDDLPDLVMSIYMLLENMYRQGIGMGDGDMESDEATLVEEEFTVSLEHLVDPTDQVNTDSKSPQALEHPTKDGSSEPKFYTAYDDIVRYHQISYSVEAQLLNSKMSAIFQLLRCVCDGKKSATISALKRVPKQGVDQMDRESRPLTKKEFKDMLSGEQPA